MPTKCKLVYLTPAEQDLEEIVKYHILEVGAKSAREIHFEIRSTIARLQSFPLMGQIHPDPLLATQGYRKLVLTRTYVAVYKVIDGVVYIYRIVNGRTNYPRLLY